MSDIAVVESGWVKMSERRPTKEDYAKGYPWERYALFLVDGRVVVGAEGSANEASATRWMAWPRPPGAGTEPQVAPYVNPTPISV